MKKLIALVIMVLLWEVYSYGQTNVFTQNFDGSWTIPSTLSPAWSGTTTVDLQWHKNDYTTGWSYSTGGAYSPTGAASTTGSARFHSYGINAPLTSDFITPVINLSSYTSGGNYLEFYHINATGTDNLKVYLSTDGGATWGNALITCGTATSWTIHSLIALGTTSANVKLKFTGTSDFGEDDIGLDQVRVYNVTSPMLNVIPNTLAFGYSPSGTPTTAQTYVLSGTNLTTGPIVVTAPTGFEVSRNGTTWTGSINVTYSPPTLPNTTIYIRFSPTGIPANYSGNISNVGGGASTNVSVSGTSVYGLCAASGGCVLYISQVVVGSINNSSSCSAGGYGDYKSLSTSMSKLAPYTITVTNGAIYADIQCGIWVDWNRDGDCYDAGESISVTGTPGVGPYTATIIAPASAVESNVILRIRITYTGDVDPCGVTTYGEVEDYTINVTPAQLGYLEGYVRDAQGGCTTGLVSATVTNGFVSTTTDGSGFYRLSGVAAGTYSFTASLTDYVSQTFDNIVIIQGDTTYQNFCLEPYLAPPVALSATVTGVNDVHLEWLAPGSIPEQWIMWDDGTNTNAIGTGAAANFAVASRWQVSDIAPFNGMFLKEIEFWPAVVSSECTYTIKVWKGVNAATLLYSYTIPAAQITEGAWNIITFPGVIIDGTNEFWFGYEVNTNSGYPAGCDDGPEIAGKGNMILWSGTWSELTALNPALTYNWNIHGWVGFTALGPLAPMQMVQVPLSIPADNFGQLSLARNPSYLLQTPANRLPADYTSIHKTFNPESTPMAPLAPLTADLTGYNVYRNNSQIAYNISNLFYDDPDLLPGGYDYQVAAQYDYGESERIGPAHVDIYSCDVPTNVQVPRNTLTTTSATAGWTPSTTSTNPEWIVEYGLAGFTHGAGIGVQHVYTPSYPMNSLTPGTLYDFYVRTYCGPGDSSLWVKKTFRTHYFECPVGATAEAETCGSNTNDGCNLSTPAFEPLACGETKCGTGYFNGTTRDTDWYEFTLDEATDVTWTGSAEFSFVLGFIASPCPATTFIAYATGAAGTTVTVRTLLDAGTYYAFAAPQFAEVVTCDSLDLYFAELTCVTCPGTLPICESFPTSDWPSCWTEQLEGLITSSHWSMVNSTFAGGAAYEALANYYPVEGETQADNDRMISPPINTNGLSTIHVSFRQMLDDFDAGVNDVWIKVQSSSDYVNWTDEWVYAGGLGNSIPAEVKDLDITNNLGSKTWIAWTLSGNTYDINNWYVDNVCITSQCLTNTWTGSANTAWNDPDNWSCGQVPDATMTVIIPTGLTNYPVIGAGVTAECFDLSVENGTIILIEEGGTFNVVNP
jgi:hypothetical protein